MEEQEEVVSLLCLVQDRTDLGYCKSVPSDSVVEGLLGCVEVEKRRFITAPAISKTSRRTHFRYFSQQTSSRIFSRDSPEEIIAQDANFCTLIRYLFYTVSFSLQPAQQRIVLYPAPASQALSKP